MIDEQQNFADWDKYPELKPLFELLSNRDPRTLLTVFSSINPLFINIIYQTAYYRALVDTDGREFKDDRRQLQYERLAKKYADLDKAIAAFKE